jgi:hypothetical protein
VKSGRRYTVALWFTKQKARCIPPSIRVSFLGSQEN